MHYLFFVTLIWSVSFGLIKSHLAALDPVALGVTRIALSALVFLPFFRPGKIPARSAVKLACIGAVEFGLMYALYLAAFQYLFAYEIASFTIFTPLWLALIDAVATRRLPARLVAAVLLAIAGAAVVCWQTYTPDRDLFVGFALVQASNLCFAAGQWWYRRERAALPPGVTDASLFAYLYLGALAITLAVSLFTTDWAAFSPDAGQWAVLVYLGVVASGLCFFLWNVGATRVNTAVLAVFNDAKIPLGVLCATLVFRETANLPRLLAGCALFAAALAVARRPSRAG